MSGYFTASSSVAGTLIGLLFVSITLRYDAVFGPSVQVRSRALAGAGFTALVNALSLSLWALVPHANLGYAAVVTGVLCLWFTYRVHVVRLGREGTSTALLVVTVMVYLYQVVIGALLVARPHDTDLVVGLSYSVFAAFAAGLSRSWQLLQADQGTSSPGGAPGTDREVSGPGALAPGEEAG